MLDETKQLVALLPYSMRERARGYMDFVNDVLYSVSLEENAHEQRREIQYEVEMVFVLKLLYAVFVTGYRNFTQVLEFLDGKGASGFEIGSSSYRQDSDLIHRWDRVVHELRSIAGEIDSNQTSPITRYVTLHGSTEAIVRAIVRYHLDSDGNNHEEI